MEAENDEEEEALDACDGCKRGREGDGQSEMATRRDGRCNSVDFN